jgi:hypothetical protein
VPLRTQGHKRFQGFVITFFVCGIFSILPFCRFSTRTYNVRATLGDIPTLRTTIHELSPILRQFLHSPERPGRRKTSLRPGGTDVAQAFQPAIRVTVPVGQAFSLSMGQPGQAVVQASLRDAMRESEPTGQRPHSSMGSARRGAGGENCAESGQTSQNVSDYASSPLIEGELEKILRADVQVG